MKTERLEAQEIRAKLVHREGKVRLGRKVILVLLVPQDHRESEVYLERMDPKDSRVPLDSLET